MTVSDWHVNAADKQDATDHAQWIQTEQTDEATICLRGAEMDGKYFNFDRQTAGSHVYSNKTRPAEFEVIKQSAMAELVHVGDLPAATDHTPSPTYELDGRPATRHSRGILLQKGKKFAKLAS